MMILLAILGCRPTVSHEVTRPAEVTVPVEIRRLAVIDRVGNDASAGALKSLQKEILRADNTRFTLVEPARSQGAYSRMDAVMGRPLPRRDLPKFCKDTGADGVLALAELEGTKEWTIETRTDTVEETDTIMEGGESKERTVQSEKEIYEAKLNIRVSSKWRLVDCNGKEIDTHHVSLGDQWVGEGDTEAEAKEAIRKGPMSTSASPDGLIVSVASSAGRAYMRRIAPYEDMVTRRYYRWAHKELRTGNKQLKAGSPGRALKRYKNAVGETSGKKRAKSHHNASVAAEQMGDLDAALKHAKKASRALGTDMAADQLRYIRERKRQESKVSEQLKSAPDNGGDKPERQRPPRDDGRQSGPDKNEEKAATGQPVGGKPADGGKPGAGKDPQKKEDGGGKPAEGKEPKKEEKKGPRGGR